MLNGAPIHWKSSVWSVVKPSSDFPEDITPPCISVGEAETYAASNAIMEFMHISYIANEMKLTSFPKPMVINMDSTVAEAFMKNNSLKSKMKHIDVRQKWVQLIRDASIAIPKHCDGTENLSDWFTKILSRAKFITNRNILMTQRR